MQSKNVKLIFVREARDQLRDRRTLFMVAVLPLLLYPALGVGMAQMMNTFAEQTRTVAVVGVADLPEPALLEADPVKQRFQSTWFTEPGDVEKLRVITDAMLEPGSTATLSPDERSFLSEARELRATIEELGQTTRRLTQLETATPPAPAAELTALEAQEARLKQEVDAWFRSGPVQVLVAVPRRYREQLDQINAGLAQRETVDALIEDSPRPVILQNNADEKSMIAGRRVREAVRTWEQKVLESRLKAANLPASLPQAFEATGVDLAADEEISATLWSKMFPILLVMMAVTGAFYPAIDLGAGEKERGTMETLLISPATRPEIVVGKFLTVTLFSFGTALLNLVSMAVTSKYILSMAGGGQLNRLGNMAAFPPASSLLWVVLLAIPLASLFSALSLALAMFAKSNKEGQYYLTPLLMVTMGLAMFCISPSVEINPYYSVFPVVGPGLLLKALLLSQPLPHLPAYAVAVLVSSLSYSALALWWAVEQFNSEEVLFREAERFEIGPWLRHVFRDREDLPSFTEAGFCFVLILMLQFASFGVLSKALQGPDVTTTSILKLQTIYLIATVGTPALLMAVMLTRKPLTTLKLRWPSWRALGAAVALVFCLLPVSRELLQSLDWFFPPLPPGMAELMASMSAQDVAWWLPLLAFAVAPAVCEELAFRGFILSGLERARNPWVPVLLSSVAFGVVHMIQQQVFNAMLLGVVIALLALVSRSLIPGLVFHFLFNGAQVALERIGPERIRTFADRTDSWLYSVSTNAAGEVTGLHFQWPLLLPCIVASVLLIGWLVRELQARTASPPEEEEWTASTPAMTSADGEVPTHPQRVSTATRAEQPTI